MWSYGIVLPEPAGRLDRWSCGGEVETTLDNLLVRVGVGFLAKSWFFLSVCFGLPPKTFGRLLYYPARERFFGRLVAVDNAGSGHSADSNSHTRSCRNAVGSRQAIPY